MDKDISEYYKHKMMMDGHLNKCKECIKRDVRTRYSHNVTDELFLKKERKRGREKYYKLYSDRRTQTNSYRQKWCEKFPEKVNASLACRTIRNKIKDTNVHLHHWSYLEEYWTDLIQLTPKEHYKAHRFLIYDQERMMYRRCDDNTLLDTRDRHESYIRLCIEQEED